MPSVALYNMEGSKVGDIDLNDAIFGVDVNQDAMHTVVLNILANMRQGTQSTKTKSEVRGGGKKPWKQKHTGRARQGSIRSAQWIKGGIVLGPKPRSYRYAVPKKIRQLALKSALSSKVADNSIYVLDSLELESIKTKTMVSLFKNLNITDSVLVVTESSDNTVQKSARNIPHVQVVPTNNINTYSLLKYNKLVLTKDAVKKIEEVYA